MVDVNEGNTMMENQGPTAPDESSATVTTGDIKAEVSQELYLMFLGMQPELEMIIGMIFGLEP